jgi:VCBS repeat-containing protein
VPPTNLASLLIDSEPQPGAGQTQSSGGNFADPVPPLDPGVPLGDLIPPTELTYNPPEVREIGQFENQKPTVVFEPHNLAPGAVDAVDSVDEKGLPARDGNLPNEPAGSGEIADGNGTNDSDPSEHTFGQIVFTPGDGLQSITLDGVSITAGSVGTTIQGQFGVLTITSVDLAHGTVGYDYVLSDNTSGDNTADHFAVIVTDTSGDTATATLTIDIIDDVPTARNDTDLVDIQTDTATGNVMTGADTTSGAAGADTVGADNAQVTGVHPGTTGGFTGVGSGGVTVVGTFGDLHINADGSYIYTLHEGVGGGGTDVFTYQLTDGDGDTSNATLTITNPDQTPIAGTTSTQVDEDGLPNGIAGGPGDITVPNTDGDNNEATNAGTLPGSGGDGQLTFDLLTTGAPSGFHYVDGPNGSIIVQQDQGGNPVDVMTITINPTTGAYTVTLTAPLDHTVTGTEDNIGLTINYTVTDADGDSASGTLNITINDDSPTVSPTLDAEAIVTLDESGPAVASTINTGSIVKGDDPDVSGSGAISSATSGSAVVDANAAFGADGPAASDSLTYALTITSATSGLSTTDGHAITLEMQNGVIVGVVQGGTFDGEAAFAISINSTTGVVTVEQYLSLDHPINPDPNDALQMLTGTVGVTVTATDGDGDSVTSGAVDISHQITFLDDGPTVDPTVHADATVTLDETGPTATSTISTGVIVKGDDPDVSGTNAISKATSGVAIVDANAAFGADGPAVSGSLSYALSITNASSGLHVTDGSAINLTMQNGVIVGVVSGGAFDGEAAFAISINATTGVVTIEQYLSLDHPITTDPNDALHMLTGSVGVTVTATDGDGDSITSGAVDISNQITFLDDGPAAHPDTNSVNEGATVTGNVETNDLFGADGKDTGGGVVGVEAGTHLSDVVTTGVGSPITGTWGTLTLNADGSYSYHADPNTNPPPGSTDVFTYTIKDGDGDTSTTTLTITVNDVTASVGSATTVVSEEVLPVVGTERNGDTDSDPTHDVLVNSGDITLTDSLGGATFTTALTAPSGTFTSGGTTIIWTLSNGGHTITGTAGANTILVATIDNTGHYTVTLSGPIDTPNGVNSGENGGDQIVVFGVTATDNLGNTLTPGTLTVHVEDDAPTIDVTKTADSGVNLTTDDADTIGTNTDHATSTANFGGVFGLTFQTGADGTNTTPTLAYTLGVSSSGVDSGLDSHGSSIFLYVIGGVVVGSTATSIGAVTTGNTIFDVSVNSSGQVTLDQFQQIDHPIASDPTPTGTPFNDQSISMADGLITLTASSSITDKDGDTATDSETVNIGANLHFTDDGPTAATNGNAIGTVTLDETRPEGTDTSGGAAPTGLASGTIDFSTNFVTGASVNYGADGPGSVGYSLHLNGSNVASGLYALDNTDTSSSDGDGFGQGGQIVLNQSGNTITGSFNGVNYFTITINPSTGVVTFTELHNIWNPVAGSTAAALDDLALLHTALASDIQVVQTVTDFDGDTSTASINVGQNVFGIEDDGPRFGTVDTTLNIDNSGAHPSGTGDMQFTIGTDSPNGALSGASPTQSPDDINVSNFAISVAGNPAQNVVLTPGAENATTASYTFAFDYDTGNGTTDHETGTLVFDKAAGTYTVTLDHPVEAFTTLETAAGQAFTGYVFNTSTVTGSQPDVAVTQILGESSPGAGDGFYVQFTGFTAGNGSHETIGDATPGTYVNGDLFSEGTSLHNSWVSATGSSNGVGGDTVNGPDALNFNLYSSDPQGFFTGQTGNPPTASASNMFMVFDGIGSSEDMIVVLKLGADTNNDGILDTFTTRAIVVSNADFYKFDAAHEAGTVAALTGTQYQGVLDAEIALGGSNNNDGLVIIESNDYNAPGENYVIIGAEVVNAAAGVTGTGINLDPAIGASGGSSTSESIADASDTGPLKITDIGFITGTSTDQNATISFDATIHDADGDTATTSVTVNVGTPPPPAPIAPAGVQTTQVVSQTSLNTSSLIATNDNLHDRSGGNIHNSVMMGALAAAGLSAFDMGIGNHVSLNSLGNHQVSEPLLHTLNLASVGDEVASVAQTDHVLQLATVVDATPAIQNSSTVHDMVEAAQALTPSNTGDAQTNTELLHGTTVPGQGGAATDAHMMAPAVVMPSAAQLAAALTHTGSAQPLNSVVGAQHDEVVGKVLADALHGGSAQGPNVDALLNAMSHAPAPGGNLGLETFASVGSGSVPFTHIPGAGAFGGFHSALTVEMVMHADAHPAAHG